MRRGTLTQVRLRTRVRAAGGHRHVWRMRRLREFTITPRAYLWVAASALLVCTLIVFTGAAVRLTGSGLGCPDWPRCEGTAHARAVDARVDRVRQPAADRRRRPPVPRRRVLAWLRRPFRRDLALVALLLPLGVLAQAVLGGMTVGTGSSPAG